MIPGSDYSIFKKGIRPMWEDKMNEKGGRWIIKLENRRSGDLNEMWLDVVSIRAHSVLIGGPYLMLVYASRVRVRRIRAVIIFKFISASLSRE